MNIEIKGNEYELNFGIKFLLELDEKYNLKGVGGSRVGFGIEVTVPQLLEFNTITLSEVMYAATWDCKKRPSYDDICRYIDNAEDIESVFSEVLDCLKKRNATKMKTEKAIKAYQDALKENS